MNLPASTPRLLIPSLVILCLATAGCEGALSAGARPGGEDLSNPPNTGSSGGSDGTGGEPSGGDITPSTGGAGSGGTATTGGIVTGPIDPSPAEGAVCTSDEYEDVPASAYTAKVKRLLTDAPPTAEELMTVQSDPASFRELVRGWVGAPGTDERLIDFFETALQQGPFEGPELTHQFGIGVERVGVLPGPHGGGDGRAAIERMYAESMARTALALAREGRPFTEVATTKRFMMTSVLMTLFAYHDDRVRPDEGHPYYRTLSSTITSKRYTNQQVPRLQVLDPTSANFMRFPLPAGASVPAGCGGDAELFTADYDDTPERCLQSILGRHSPFRAEEVGSGCAVSASTEDSWLGEDAWSDWHWVEIRQPAGSEATDQFYEVASRYLRDGTAGDELVLHTPRTGFFSTPAFLAVWPTNLDNSARVTLNQTLIAGLGYTLSIQDSPPLLESFQEADHAAPGTSCYGCHFTLDPMRNFFRKNLSIYGSEQLDSDAQDLDALFWVGADSEPGQTLDDLGLSIANNKLFAKAWTQKLCYFANSAPCPADSDEFKRIATNFENSGFDIIELLVDLLSSPLVTGAECFTGATGHLPSIARQRYFCGALARRLDLPDPCGRKSLTLSGEYPYTRANRALSPTIPDDAFSRGSAEPLTISAENMFIFGTYNRLCEKLAPQVVRGGALFDPKDVAGAIGKLTSDLMGVSTEDSRFDDIRLILQEHYDDAESSSGDSTLALRSTFVLACNSPLVTSIGF